LFFLGYGVNKQETILFINLTSWGITKQNMLLNDICSGSNFMAHWKKVTIHFDIFFTLILCIESINVSKFWKISSKDHRIYLVQIFIAIQLNGPIFLRRFRLYVLSFMFRFMFANICFEKNENSKIYVMFIINITWNKTWNNLV
jgi:hypothetical protein